MPIGRASIRFGPDWSGGRPYGSLVASPFSTMVSAELEEGTNNLWGGPNGDHLGAVDVYHDAVTDTWTEYWVLFDKGAYAAALHGGDWNIEWVAGGLPSWSVRKNYWLDEESKAGGNWKVFEVVYQYLSSWTSGHLGTSTVQRSELKLQGNVVGYLAHMHRTANHIREQWILHPTYQPPTNGQDLDIEAMADGPVGPLGSSAPGGSEFVDVDTTIQNLA